MRNVRNRQLQYFGRIKRCNAAMKTTEERKVEWKKRQEDDGVNWWTNTVVALNLGSMSPKKVHFWESTDQQLGWAQYR